MKLNGIAVGFGQLIREWSFEGLFLSALPAVEPQPVAELQWATEPPVDDEWSGLSKTSL